MEISFDLTVLSVFEKSSFKAKILSKAVEYVPTDD